jgi:stage II sporulation protein AB (anti-sigma F factor)
VQPALSWDKRMNVRNYVHFEFTSLPENVSFARSCVGAFASQLDCTLDDIEEIKLVVSEAVSNSIIHGYGNNTGQKVEVMVSIMDNGSLEIIVKDYGKGISNIEQLWNQLIPVTPAEWDLASPLCVPSWMKWMW